MIHTNILTALSLLTFVTALQASILPSAKQVSQLSDAGLTLGSNPKTPFLEAVNYVPRGSTQGTFLVSRLQLLQPRNAQISLGFYAIHFTRDPIGRFRTPVATPRNSDATLQFTSENNAIRLRLEVRSTVRRSTFIYEGIVNLVAGASPTPSTLTLNQIDSVTFISAEERTFAGTFGTVQIARRTTTPQASANLSQVQPQPVPLSTTPPSPLASSSLPGRSPILAADNNLFTSFQSRPESNPYFTIATRSGPAPIQLISLTATSINTFSSSGVRVFVGDCVREPAQGPSQIVRYLNDPASASGLISCSGSAGVRAAFECEQVQNIRGFPNERIEFYCGTSKSSYGFLYVTTSPNTPKRRELGITEITATRNA